MALHCVYGSAISDKTGILYEELIKRSLQEPEKQFILLVPEQVSLSAQQALIDRHPRHGLFNVDVLTFNRLAYRVFQEVGKMAGTLLDDSGKEMLLRLVVARNQDKLHYLQRNLHKNGFISELKSVVSEFAEYDISPKLVLENVDSLKEHPALMNKMADIGLIYQAFMELLHEHYELAEERLTRLAQMLSDWPRISQTYFYLDDYTGFTPPQYDVLRELIRHAGDVTIGMTLGGGADLSKEKEEDSLFHMTARMAENCKAMAIENGVSFDEIRLPEQRGLYQDEIAHLEGALFRYPQKVYAGDLEAVDLVKFADYRSEIRFVISRIQESVRSGAQYRENAIVCGSLEDYREELESALKAAGIPYFMDAAAPLAGNPLFLLITDLLELCRENYSFDSVFRILKNPIMVSFLGKQMDTFSPYDLISEIENFALARGFRGKRLFTVDWEGDYKGFCPDRLPYLNEAKSILLTEIAGVEEVLLDDDLKVGDRIQGLLDFLRKVQADDFLQETGKELTEQGNDAGMVFLHGTEALSRLTEEILAILGEEKLSFEEFRQVLLTGIQEMKLGIAPPTKDRLVIGDIRRTRLGPIKNLFVIGANEGIFPGQKDGSGLITDWDREVLASRKLLLSDTAKQDSFHLQFYVYLLLTRPRNTLTITYPMISRQGKSLNPSYVISNVQAAFEGLSIRYFRDREVQPNTEKEVELSASGTLRDLKVRLDQKMSGPEENQRKNEMGEGESGADDPGEDNPGGGALAEEPREKVDLVKEALGKEAAAAVPEKNLAELRWLLQQEEGKKTFDALKRAVFYRYESRSLPGTLARDLYGEIIQGSVTKLEKFAACPQAYFLEYGLAVREREKHRLNSADYGLLYHASLDRFFRHLEEDRIEWRFLDEDLQEKLARQCVEEAAAENGNSIFKDSARNAYSLERAIRMIRRTVWALQKQWQAGTFDRIETEIPFSGAGNVKGLCLPLSNGGILLLQGKIDRLDTRTEGDAEYLKVIDYKSGKKTLDATRIYYGLQLQLMLYLKAAEMLEQEKTGKLTVPAGVYYYQIQDPLLEDKEKDSLEEEILKELRMNGVTDSSEDSLKQVETDFFASKKSRIIKGLSINKNNKKGENAGKFSDNALIMTPEEFREAGDFVLKKAVSLAETLRSGVIEVSPFLYQKEDSCAYCPYREICRFDARIPGFRRRSLKKKEFTDICKEDEGGQEHG